MTTDNAKYPEPIETMVSWSRFLSGLPLEWKVVTSAVVVALAAAVLWRIWAAPAKVAAPAQVIDTAARRASTTEPLPAAPAARPSAHLTRPLTLSGMSLGLERVGERVYLRQLKFNLRNTGPDMVAYRMTQFHGEGSPLPLWEVPTTPPRHVPAGMDADSWIEPTVDVVVPPAGITYSVGVEVTYDTLPPTGERKSYRRVEFRVARYYTFGGLPAVSQRLVDDRED